MKTFKRKKEITAHSVDVKFSVTAQIEDYMFKKEKSVLITEIVQFPTFEDAVWRELEYDLGKEILAVVSGKTAPFEPYFAPCFVPLPASYDVQEMERSKEMDLPKVQLDRTRHTLTPEMKKLLEAAAQIADKHGGDGIRQQLLGKPPKEEPEWPDEVL